MQEAVNLLLVEILKFGIVAFVSLIVPLLIQQLRRAGVQLSAEKEARLNQVALIAAAEVEEWAAVKLKANVPISSHDKLQKGIESVLNKIPGVTEQEAKAALQAALPQIGLGAAAGLREVGKAIANGEK
jgi:alkylhydroperoxidase/carboxymuconolactone decarboxylase family protein YurZ